MAEIKISQLTAATSANGSMQLETNDAGTSKRVTVAQILTDPTIAGSPTLSAGTANGVLYLNGSKVATSGSALIFNGTNLGIGVTPSAWGAGVSSIQFGQRGAITYGGGQVLVSNNWYYDGNDKYLASATASMYYQEAGTHVWRTAPSGTAGNAITFTQAMTLDASGNLVVGSTLTPSSKVGIAGDLIVSDGGNVANAGGAINFAANAISRSPMARIKGLLLNADGTEDQGGLAFYTRPSGTAPQTLTERARITSGGDLLVGTTNASPVVNNVAGILLNARGVGSFSADGDPPIFANRKSNDGDLVNFYQDGTQEGSISVSGTTVSYNAFAGSHWSQLQDGSKPEILRGTVMESIDELCEWPDEPQSERLCRVKISDTGGSKKVYGVFMDWDNDWTATNDMLVTSLGAFVCRVNGSVEAQQGDLLESNGDGTARVQADDIIRSSTIGKVTSTVKTHEHPDGSYCVPTVLYCG